MIRSVNVVEAWLLLYCLAEPDALTVLTPLSCPDVTHVHPRQRCARNCKSGYTSSVSPHAC